MQNGSNGILGGLGDDTGKQQRLIAGVNDTSNKFFAGVDTAEQFITGVVDTGDKK